MSRSCGDRVPILPKRPSHQDLEGALRDLVQVRESLTEAIFGVLLGSSLTGPCMKALQLPSLPGAIGNACMKILRR